MSSLGPKRLLRKLKALYDDCRWTCRLGQPRRVACNARRGFDATRVVRSCEIDDRVGSLQSFDMMNRTRVQIE